MRRNNEVLNECFPCTTESFGTMGTFQRQFSSPEINRNIDLIMSLSAKPLRLRFVKHVDKLI